MTHQDASANQKEPSHKSKFSGFIFLKDKKGHDKKKYEIKIFIMNHISGQSSCFQLFQRNFFFF